MIVIPNAKREESPDSENNTDNDFCTIEMAKKTTSNVQAKQWGLLWK